MAFNLGTTRPTLSFGGTQTAGNNAPGSSLFLGLNTKSTTTPSSTADKGGATGGLFLGLPQSKPADSSSNPFAQSTNLNTNTGLGSQQQSTSLGASTLSTGGPQIDIAHLRSTTKYDHLTPQLQQEILGLDTAILNQIRQCTDVSDLLPAVISAGQQLAPAIDYVNTKLDELETGLENDAEAVVGLRDDDLGKDEGEAKCVFRTVDRLKVPRQYQVGNVDGGSGTGGPSAAGGGTAGGSMLPPGAAFNGGLSGWWNQPQTLRGGRSVRAGGAGLSVQLVDEDMDADDRKKGPKTILELLDKRADEMKDVSDQHRQLLGEIEDFVGGLEEKVYSRERELNERLDNGDMGGAGSVDAEYGLQREREHQMQLLRFVFGEVQKNLYEVAESIGTVRDGVVELGLKR